MIRITLMDGSSHDIARGDTRALLPYAHVFTSPLLRAPIEAVVCHQGRPIPVLGPLPEMKDLSAPANERPWILVMEGHAQVIRGLPNFAPSATINQSFAAEAIDAIDNLLKAA